MSYTVKIILQVFEKGQTVISDELELISGFDPGTCQWELILPSKKHLIELRNPIFKQQKGKPLEKHYYPTITLGRDADSAVLIKELQQLGWEKLKK